jgi:hypothetical protein
MTSNRKTLNCTVVDLFESYNLHIKFTSIWVQTKNIWIFKNSLVPYRRGHGGSSRYITPVRGTVATAVGHGGRTPAVDVIFWMDHLFLQNWGENVKKNLGGWVTRWIRSIFSDREQSHGPLTAYGPNLGPVLVPPTLPLLFITPPRPRLIQHLPLGFKHCAAATSAAASPPAPGLHPAVARPFASHRLHPAVALLVVMNCLLLLFLSIFFAQRVSVVLFTSEKPCGISVLPSEITAL